MRRQGTSSDRERFFAMGYFGFPLSHLIEAGVERAAGHFHRSPSSPHTSALPPSPERADSMPSATARLVQAQNEARAKFQRDPKTKQTYCNDATLYTVRQIGAPQGPFANPRGIAYTANHMAENLAVSTQYRDVTPGEAQQLANQGHLVVGTWRNKQGHGHVATVRPEGISGDERFGLHGPLLNDIGGSDRISHQSGAFERGDNVYYYTPYAGGGH